MSRYTSQDGKMARFGFCASQILDLGGDGGLLFHFISSKIVVQRLYSYAANESTLNDT